MTPAAPPTSADTPSRAHPIEIRKHHRRRLAGHTARWLGEAVVVFAGVYAAFVLNRWQVQQQDQRVR